MPAGSCGISTCYIGHKYTFHLGGAGKLAGALQAGGARGEGTKGKKK